MSVSTVQATVNTPKPRPAPDARKREKIDTLLKSHSARVKAGIAYPKQQGGRNIQVFIAEDLLKHPEYMTYAAIFNKPLLISDGSRSKEALQKATHGIFDSIHVPAERAKRTYTPADIDAVFKQHLRENPESNDRVGCFVINGRSPEALKLAQETALTQTPALYNHFDPDKKNHKNVYFRRVEPETGFYMAGGKPFLYDRPLTDDKQLNGTRADGATNPPPNKHTTPVDNADIADAYKKIDETPVHKPRKAWFARLIAHDRSVGAAALLDKKAEH